MIAIENLQKNTLGKKDKKVGKRNIGKMTLGKIVGNFEAVP